MLISTGRYHIGIFRQPTDQVLCSPDLGECDQNKVEGSTPKSMWWHQKIHCGSDHQNQLWSGAYGERENIP